MEITKEFIVENINQALQFNDYELDKQELILLDKVVENHYDDIACWRYEDYRYFAELVCGENFTYALRQYDLIDQNDLDLPSGVIINLEDYEVDEGDVEVFIGDYLSETYGYCVYDFDFEIKNNKKSILVSNIGWDY